MESRRHSLRGVPRAIANLTPHKRYDSIGSDPAHGGVRRARGSIAGSLSIEPFERSRWRVRRARVVSYVLSIVRSTVCGAYAEVLTGRSRRSRWRSG